MGCRDRNILQFLGASVTPEGIMLVTEFMEVGSLQGFVGFRRVSSGCGRSACGEQLRISARCCNDIDARRCTGHIVNRLRGLHASRTLQPRSCRAPALTPFCLDSRQHSPVLATQHSACSWACAQCAGGSLPKYVSQPC